VLRALARLQPQDAAANRARLLALLAEQPTLSAALLLLGEGSDATKGLEPEPPLDDEARAALRRALAASARPLQRYRCAACGFEARHWFWQCPGCLVCGTATRQGASRNNSATHGARRRRFACPAVLPPAGAAKSLIGLINHEKQ